MDPVERTEDQLVVDHSQEDRYAAQETWLDILYQHRALAVNQSSQSP